MTKKQKEKELIELIRKNKITKKDFNKIFVNYKISSNIRKIIAIYKTDLIKLDYYYDIENDIFIFLKTVCDDFKIDESKTDGIIEAQYISFVKLITNRYIQQKIKNLKNKSLFKIPKSSDIILSDDIQTIENIFETNILKFIEITENDLKKFVNENKPINNISLKKNLDVITDRINFIIKQIFINKIHQKKIARILGKSQPYVNTLKKIGIVILKMKLRIF